MRCFDANAASTPDSGIFGLTSTPDESLVHVVAVPFDATASYRKGAALAPEAIVRASRQVDLFDLTAGRPYEAGIALLEGDGGVAELNREASRLADGIIAVGGDVKGRPDLAADLARVNAIGAEVNAIVHGRVKEILDADRFPAVVGGDHSCPFGAIQAVAERWPGVGLLHFDAHADLRVAYEGFEWSHASIMDNVLRHIDGVAAIVQVGVRDFCEAEYDVIRSSKGRVRTLFDREWAAARFEGRDLRALIRQHLAHVPKEVFVTFDVDGLDPALCPNTGTPVPGGITWREAELWLEELARSGHRVVGLDINEVNPGSASDDVDSWDAMVGARLLYRLITTALATRDHR
jgi:agmatinase